MSKPQKSLFSLLSFCQKFLQSVEIWQSSDKEISLHSFFWDTVYIEDRLTGDWRLTSHLRKFQMAISPQGVVRSTSCLVLRWGFWGRRIEWRYFRFRQIQDGAELPSTAILENSNGISPRRIIRFTLCLVLGWGLRGQQIEWRYFRFRQIQDGGSAAISENSNSDILAADRPIYSVFGSRARFLWVCGSNGANCALTKFNRYVGEKMHEE